MNLPKVLTEHQKPSPSTSVVRKDFFPRKNRTLPKLFLLFNIFWQKSAKFLISTRKKSTSFVKNQIFTEIFCTHQLQFWQTFWCLCEKRLECFPHSPETVKILRHLRRKNFPIKNLQCAHIMQFWQTYRKSFAESPKNLCPKTKNTFQKYPLDTWKQFWQPNKIIFDRIPKCFPQSLKTTEKFESFVKKKFISSKMSSGHKENSFDHHVKKNLQNSKHFPSKSVSRR